LRPVLGRLPDDRDVGDRAVAVLSNGFWKGALGADASVLNRTLVLDGSDYQIVGVLGPEVEVGDFGRVAAWVATLELRPDAPRDSRSLWVAARLKPEVAIAAANAELAALARAQEEASPRSNRGWSARVRPVREAFRGDESSVLAL